MNYRQVYNHLLERVRKDVKVYHRHTGFGLDGFYDAEYQYIVINARLKETKRGVCALAHEWTHFLDNKAGKYKSFFDTKRKKYSIKLMKEVIDAEQSAGRGASKVCLEYGKVYYPEELHPQRLLELIAFWRDFYFED